MTINNSAIGIYNSHSDAEAVIRDFQKAGFDMKKISIVGKDYQTEEHVIGYYTTGDSMKYWGKLGVFWGGVCGLLFGSGVFLIPGVGPVMVLGPLVGWIAGALESALITGGLTALGAGLLSAGIPKDSILKYETEIKSGKFFVIAHGTPADAQKASQIIEATHPALTALHK